MGIKKEPSHSLPDLGEIGVRRKDETSLLTRSCLGPGDPSDGHHATPSENHPTTETGKCGDRPTVYTGPKGPFRLAVNPDGTRPSTHRREEAGEGVPSHHRVG